MRMCLCIGSVEGCEHTHPCGDPVDDYDRFGPWCAGCRDQIGADVAELAMLMEEAEGGPSVEG